MDLLNRERIGSRDMVWRRAHLDAVGRDASADRAPQADGREDEWRIESPPDAECPTGLLKLAFLNRLSYAGKFTRVRRPAETEIGTPRQWYPGFPFAGQRCGLRSEIRRYTLGVFRRRHRQEDFEGTGTGLATRRTNHRSSRRRDLGRIRASTRCCVLLHAGRPAGRRAIQRSERGEE
jgi:light-regulated signal transduction histidine kinase (bacteriophytochrome)